MSSHRGAVLWELNSLTIEQGCSEIVKIITLKMNQKSKGVALVLSLFLGGFGAHKFYLGRTTAGVFYLIFCWTFIPALINVIDFWVLVFTSQQRFDEKYNGQVNR